MLIWRPRLRPWMLAGAVVLHAGIGACLGMWTFALIMLVGCASFLPADRVRDLLAALSRDRSRGEAEAEPAPFSATPLPSVSWSSRSESPGAGTRG